jgi:hypothetical protein
MSIVHQHFNLTKYAIFAEERKSTLSNGPLLSNDMSTRQQGWKHEFSRLTLSLFTWPCKLLYFPITRCHSNKYNVKFYTRTADFYEDSYIKNKSYMSCKKSLLHKYPGVCVQNLLEIFRLMKTVCSTESSLDNTYTTQNAVLTKAI